MHKPLSSQLRTAILALAAVGSAAFGGSAQAQVSASFQSGVGGISAGEVLYADFSGGSTGGVSGANWIIQSSSNGAGADPAVGGQGDPYLSVLGGGTANFVFAGLSQLGMDYGSADWYNNFAFMLSNGATRVFTGQELINTPPANGDQGASRTNGRLTFTPDAGTSITGLTLSSSSNSLEVDNFGVVAAVPEPSTWAMILFGFGAVGFSMRRRKTIYRLAQAA